MEAKSERIVREQERRKITGLSRSQALRLEREGHFPQRRKLGKNAVGWLESELQAWVTSRVAGLK